MLYAWLFPCHHNCSVNTSSICWNVSSEIFYSFLQIGPENPSFFHICPSHFSSTLLSWVSEEMEPLVDERTPRWFLSWASVLSLWVASATQHLTCGSWQLLGQAFPDVHALVMSISATVLGHWVGFPSALRRRRLWSPCHHGILPESIWNLTFGFFLSLQLLDLLLPTNKWHRVKLVKNREESPGNRLVRLLFFRKCFWPSSGLCCVLLRGTGRVSDVLIAEILSASHLMCLLN